MRKIFPLLLIAFAFVSCKPKQAPAQAAPEEVLAKVGKYTITKEEYNERIKEVSQRAQNYLSTESGKKQFLEILIREKIILNAAADSDITQNHDFIAEMQTAKQEMEKRYQEFHDYMITKMWLEEMSAMPVMQVTEDEIKAYYNKYPYETTVRHILMANPQKASQLLKTIKNGRDFETLAKTHSIDYETASAGGKVKPFIYGEFLPELEEAVYGMQTDKVEGVFKSKFGYHIILKEKRRKLTYSQAKDRILLILEKQKLDNYLQLLTTKYQVEVLDENYIQN